MTHADQVLHATLRRRELRTVLGIGGFVRLQAPPPPRRIPGATRAQEAEVHRIESRYGRCHATAVGGGQLEVLVIGHRPLEADVPARIHLDRHCRITLDRPARKAELS